MKRAERQEAKANELQAINQTRDSIQSRLFGTKIPDAVVNGSLNAVVDYKNACEEACALCRLKVHEKKSLKFLTETRAKLEVLQQKIAA